MVEERTDEMLMTAVRRGRTRDLGPLFERHSRRLFGFLRGLVGSPSEAEELVQETFLKLLRHRHTYRPGKPFLPWMLGIARHAAWASLGKQARMPVTELKERIEAASQEDLQIEHERAEALAKALGVLPDGDREVLLLSYFDGLRHRDIAELVDSSPGAIKVRIHRARQVLRGLLSELETKT